MADGPGDLGEAVEQALSGGATGVVVRQGGAVVAEAGDTARAVNVRSVRKSLLGALYGSAVADGLIDPLRTLAEIGIDERGTLTEPERRATVRDLLMSRSGVYLPAAYSSPAMDAGLPARGAHPPGAVWHYGNWGFNALGTVYERLAGRGVFEAFADLVADPIGMEDFDPAACRRVFEPVSEHPAHTMRVSARDLARFGQLYLDGGRRGGRRVVPARWVAESTATLSATGRPAPGYGYLWWTLADDDPLGPGCFLALGTGGQGLAVVPSRRLVVAQVVDAAEGRERLQSDDFLRLVRSAA